MYINPNSTIKILQNVPLDNTYEHTIYFASNSAQSSYFNGLTKYTFEAQSYQRVKRGYIRVATNAEKLYNCNYLMFQNSAFGSKWFYAFIKSVEYINNAVSEIEFEIDVLQTWFFDYDLNQCFVEREHTPTDVQGQNIIPEKLETGEYIITNQKKAGVSEILNYVVDSTINKNYDDYVSQFYTMLDHQVFSGLCVINFGKNVGELSLWLNGQGEGGEGKTQEQKMALVQSSVNNIRIAPKTMQQSVSFSGVTNVGGYIPRNKKLLTYPYCFCYVTNNNGNTAVFPFEYFQNNQPNFILCTDELPSSPAILYPMNYKGLSQNTDEKITLNNFPTLSWSSRYYDYWLAQAQTTKIPNLVTNIVAGAATGALATGASPEGVLAGAGIGALSGAANLMSESRWADMQPPQSHGTTTGMTDYWKDLIDFHIMTKTITPEVAKTIDDYFDRFGYSVHRNKIPNRNVRPHWTYTKTSGCTITGSVPSDDMKKICSIYDKGITFWKNGANVGNYNLNNRV